MENEIVLISSYFPFPPLFSFVFPFLYLNLLLSLPSHFPFHQINLLPLVSPSHGFSRPLLSSSYWYRSCVSENEHEVCIYCKLWAQSSRSTPKFTVLFHRYTASISHCHDTLKQPAKIFFHSCTASTNLKGGTHVVDILSSRNQKMKKHLKESNTKGVYVERLGYETSDAENQIVLLKVSCFWRSY